MNEHQNLFNWSNSAIACFTWKASGTLEPCLVLPPGSKYVYQLEKGEGEQEYLHYQGYVKFPKVMTKAQLKGICSVARWSNRRGSHNACIRYCSKEETRIGSVVNVGMELCAREGANGRGIRSDLHVARELILGKRTWAQIVQDPDLTDVVANHRNWCMEIHAHRPIDPLSADLRPWQEGVVSLAVGPVHPRKIYWIWESVGNVGKSFLCTYLQRNHRALVLDSGKNADVAHCYDNHEIVCFDLARCNQESVNYGVMENLKNGRIFSPKYSSHVKSFPVPHVFAFANFPPKEAAFSADRVEVIDPGARDAILLRTRALVCPGAPKRRRKVATRMSTTDDNESVAETEMNITEIID